MGKARDLSITLATRFLESGSFAASPGAMEHSLAMAVTPTPAITYHPNEYSGFEGLAVQSVGYAETDDRAEVIIYVTKGSQAALRKLSQEVRNVEVVVRRMGPLRVRPESAMSASAHGLVFEYNGRIACGSSCAPASEKYSGTLGAIVSKESGDLFFLSNNHVFASCNHTPVNMPVLSPSPADARPGVRAPSEVCVHSEIIELRSGVPSLVTPVQEDAAIARITSSGSVTSWQGDSTSGYDTPATAIDPDFELKVKKVGRTTGLTFGTVEAFVEMPTVIPYKSRHFNALVWLSHVWTIRADDPSDHFALPGDSGSLVVTQDGENAVGLIFACSNKGEYGWMIPLSRVLGGFSDRLSLVHSHGI